MPQAVAMPNGGYPAQRNGYAPVPMQHVHQQHNSAAIGSVVVGAIAFCLSIVGLLPGSTVYFYSAGGVFAIIGGARALMRRRQGYGTSFVASVIAILLGSVAVIFMLTGILVHNLGGDDTLQTGAAGTTSNSAPQVSSGDSESNATVPAAPTFATDSQLTAYEQSAAEVALDIDQNANGGLAFTPIAHWPGTVSVTSDGTILLPSGTSPGQLPSGQQMRYLLSADKRSFEVIVTGANQQEFAIYDSSVNGFTWTCATGDATCPPGGVAGNTGSGNATTTNS
jgi:hypothetical protein